MLSRWYFDSTHDDAVKKIIFEGRERDLEENGEEGDDDDVIIIDGKRFLNLFDSFRVPIHYLTSIDFVLAKELNLSPKDIDDMWYYRLELLVDELNDYNKKREEHESGQNTSQNEQMASMQNQMSSNMSSMTKNMPNIPNVPGMPSMSNLNL